MAFGFDRLREIRLELDAAYDDVIVKRNRAEILARKSMLGRTLVDVTINNIPPRHNGQTFLPKTTHNKFISSFLETLRHPDFPIDTLRLHTSGDTTSRWMRYDLRVEDETVQIAQTAAKFRATSYGHFSDIGDVDSHMVAVTNGEMLPVEFNSEQYQFIRAVCGVFLPKVVEILEAEGL